MPATFVYVISGDHGRQKIGVSDDPRRRIAQLQTGSPFPLKFEFVGMTDGSAYEIEVEAHFLLSRHKAEGGDEWFIVPPEVAITAVMVAARQRGLALRPVDPDNIPQASVPAIGAPAPQKWLRLTAAALTFAVVWNWLLNLGRSSAGASIIVLLVAIGLFALIYRVLTEARNMMARFDHYMHPPGGPRVPLFPDQK